MVSTLIRFIVVALALTQGLAHADTPLTVRGAGSSAAKHIYTAWADAFAKAGGNPVEYASVGSSKGVAAIRSRDVEFGASDVAPDRASLDKDALVVVPTVVSGVVPFYNLPELKAHTLHLDGDTLVRIFMGKITRWNDPALVALNPGAPLPAADIRVVVRADGSGTTYNFTDYLSKVSAAWKSQHGAANRIQWFDGVIATPNSGGVVKAVQATPGAISYVDYTYALKDKLSGAIMKNRAGVFVPPTIEHFRAALSASPWQSAGEFTQTLTDQPGADSWPITMGTFVLLPKIMDETTGIATLRFFTHAFMHGDELASKANFVRLPDVVQAKAYRALATITSPAGTPIAYASLGQ